MKQWSLQEDNLASKFRKQERHFKSWCHTLSALLCMISFTPIENIWFGSIIDKYLNITKEPNSKWTSAISLSSWDFRGWKEKLQTCKNMAAISSTDRTQTFHYQRRKDRKSHKAIEPKTLVWLLRRAMQFWRRQRTWHQWRSERPASQS